MSARVESWVSRFTAFVSSAAIHPSYCRRRFRALTPFAVGQREGWIRATDFARGLGALANAIQPDEGDTVAGSRRAVAVYFGETFLGEQQTNYEWFLRAIWPAGGVKCHDAHLDFGLRNGRDEATVLLMRLAAALKTKNAKRESFESQLRRYDSARGTDESDVLGATGTIGIDRLRRTFGAFVGNNGALCLSDRDCQVLFREYRVIVDSPLNGPTSFFSPLQIGYVRLLDELFNLYCDEENDAVEAEAAATLEDGGTTLSEAALASPARSIVTTIVAAIVGRASETPKPSETPIVDCAALLDTLEIQCISRRLTQGYLRGRFRQHDTNVVAQMARAPKPTASPGAPRKLPRPLAPPFTGKVDQSAVIESLGSLTVHHAALETLFDAYRADEPTRNEEGDFLDTEEKSGALFDYRRFLSDLFGVDDDDPSVDDDVPPLDSFGQEMCDGRAATAAAGLVVASAGGGGGSRPGTAPRGGPRTPCPPGGGVRPSPAPPSHQLRLIAAGNDETDGGVAPAAGHEAHVSPPKRGRARPSSAGGLVVGESDRAVIVNDVSDAALTDEDVLRKWKEYSGDGNLADVLPTTDLMPRDLFEAKFLQKKDWMGVPPTKGHMATLWKRFCKRPEALSFDEFGMFQLHRSQM